MKKLIVLIPLIFALLVSGCTETGPAPDPLQIVKDSTEKLDNLNSFEINYDYAVNMPEYFGMSLKNTGYVTMYKKGEKTRMDMYMSMATLGMTINMSNFYFPDEIYACTNSRSGSSCSEDMVSQSMFMDPERSAEIIESMVNRGIVRLGYLNKGSVMGRDCHNISAIFDISKLYLLTDEEMMLLGLNTTAMESIDIVDTLVSTQCYDIETGLSLSIGMFMEMDMGKLGSQYSQYMSTTKLSMGMNMTATSYEPDKDIPDSVFELPDSGSTIVPGGGEKALRVIRNSTAKLDGIDSYEIIYDSKTTVLGMTINGKINVYKKGDKTRTDTIISGMGLGTEEYTTSNYYLPEGTFSCSTSLLSDDKKTCTKGESTSSSMLEPEKSLENMENMVNKGVVTLGYQGLKNIAGRQCHDIFYNFDLSKIGLLSEEELYVLGLNTSTFSILEMVETYELTQCLDEETGMPLDISMYTKMNSSGTGSYGISASTEILMTATSYEPNKALDDSVFELPAEPSIPWWESDLFECADASILIQDGKWDNGTLNLTLNNYGSKNLTLFAMLTYENLTRHPNGMEIPLTKIKMPAGETKTITIEDVTDDLDKVEIQAEECSGVQGFIRYIDIQGLGY